MEEFSVTPEIPLNRRENEVGNSVTVAVKSSAGKNSVTVTGAAVNSDVCRDLSANRWPQEETMALLRIRSEMDDEFKSSAVKSFLWEEISRKMAELGCHRSGRKCKEKFENVNKYRKRRTPGPIGKSYWFSNELETLDHHHISAQTSAAEQIGTAINDTPIAANPISSNPPYIPQMVTPVAQNFDPSSFTSTSATSCSGSESEGTRAKKRKWADLFDKMMTSVLVKQEHLQNKFLEEIDKREHERLAREEAWKTQELERIRRQQELLMQERSITAAKDAAIMSFLQKISEKGKFSEISGQVDVKQRQEMRIVCRKEDNDGDNSASRWPKEEVEALVRIKSKMEVEQQRLGPLWDDISMAMKNIGYDRGAKKCKEKWENINKYYRRVKESKKHRRNDSKTCPYFYLLDSLYNMKAGTPENSFENSDPQLSHGELLLHMTNCSPGQEQAVLQQHQGKHIMNGVPIQNGHQNHNDAGKRDASDVGY